MCVQVLTRPAGSDFKRNIISLITILVSWGSDGPWGQAQLQHLYARTEDWSDGGLSCWLPRTVKNQVSEMPQACILGEERDISVLSSQGAPGHTSMWSPEGWRARLV